MGVTRVRYSEAFKRQVVDQLESGKYRSLHAACRAYDIGGTATVARWVRQYGSEELLPKNVRVETLKERNELKELRRRVREVEAAAADAHIDYCLEKAYLHVACERMGVEVAEFKKKHAMTLSDTRRQRRVM